MALFQYRGIRIRPWMRKLNVVIPTTLSIALLSPAGLFVFKHQEKLQALDTKVMVTTITLATSGLTLGLLLAYLFIERTALGAKVDRLRILSRYLYDHKFYYEKKRQGQSGNPNIKFPKVYMRQRKYDLDVYFEMAGNKFQEKFKKMGGELETSFFMDYMETADERKYKMYTMAYSAFLNRIDIPEVSFVKGKGLKLMKNFYWNFDSDPHMIVAGGTGGGKTVFLRSLILGLSKIGVVDICDPKYADFVTMAELDAFKGRVGFTTEEIVEMFEKAHIEMMERYRIMNEKRKELKQKDLGKYYEYDMKPYFLVCDEFNALKAVISSDLKLLKRFDTALTQLILKGRQAGVNVIIALQKPSREDLSSKMQANMNMRIVVGRLDEYGYDTMFGEINRTKDFKYIKRLMGKRVYGRGYAAINGEVAREFYSPNLTKTLVFYDEFAKVKRISNPYSYIENPKVLPDIIHNSDVKDISEQVAQEDSTLSNHKLKLNLKEEEDKTMLTEHAKKSTLTAKEVSDCIGIEPRHLRKIVTQLEKEDYQTFQRNDKGHLVFSEEDAKLLQELFTQKVTYEGSWSDLFRIYF